MGHDHGSTMAIDYDTVIVGGTIQARAVAAAAARQGARIALVEESLAVDTQICRQLTLEVLSRAGENRQQQYFPGPPPPISEADWLALGQRVTAALPLAYPHLALDILAPAGVDIVAEPGQFIPKPRLTFTTPSRCLRGRAYLLSPPTAVTVPAMPRLAEIPLLTPDTLLQLPSLPRQIAIMGRSPDAIALAQALALLGSQTTLICRGNQILPTEDRDISEFVESLLLAVGVDLRLNARIDAIHQSDAVAIQFEDGEYLKVPHLLLATARQPQLGPLNLDRIHLKTSGPAIAVDDQLTTTRPRCFAFGPCLGGYWADHTDQQDGQVALFNALYLPWRKLQSLIRVGQLATIPEFARFGMTAGQARHHFGPAAVVLQIPYGEIPKLHLDDRMTGFCRCIIHQHGQVLGAQIIGPRARELAQTLALLAHRRLTIQSISQMPQLPLTDTELLHRLFEGWRQQRWRPGQWRRDWAENWFNWRRSGFKH